MGSPKKAPNAIARSTANGTAAQNGHRAIPYSAVDVSSPTEYAPTAKKATKPRSRRPARPSVMLRPKPIRMYRTTTATTCAKNGPTPWGSQTTSRIRSEEHTSELQSRLHLLCRLLLVKINHMESQTGYSFPALLPHTKPDEHLKM